MRRFDYSLLILIAVTIVAFIFGTWELMEKNFFWDADPVAMHYLYITRGAASSLLLAIWASWYTIKIRRRYEEKVRKSEELYRAIFESCDDAITLVDLNGIVLGWNVSAERIYGFKREEAIGKNLPIIPEEKQKELKWLIQKVAKGEIIRNYETRRITKDGHMVDILLTICPVRDKGSEIIARLGLARDITEWKKSQRQVEDAEKLASIGKLAAGIAHQLNTPIGTILLNAELLRDSLKDRDDFPDLLKIERQARHCREIIGALLAFSRRSESKKELIDLNDLLGEILLLLRGSLFAKKIEMHVIFGEERCPIFGDQNQLQQLLVNLIDNSADAMPDGGEIRISTRLLNGKEVELQVSDTGCGIPIGNIPKIFDPFFTTKGAGKGTGLGLSICHKIVQEHDGEIRVISEPGKGSKFFINFPLYKVDSMIPILLQFS